MLSGSCSDCLCCFFYRTEDEACHNIVSHHPHNAQRYTHGAGMHAGPWSTASTSLSCPDFSAFFEADLTLLLADPAEGGQKAEEINHAFQSLDHGLKLANSYDVLRSR